MHSPPERLDSVNQEARCTERKDRDRKLLREGNNNHHLPFLHYHHHRRRHYIS